MRESSASKSRSAEELAEDQLRSALPVSLFREIKPISGVRFIWHESTDDAGDSRITPLPATKPASEDVQEFEQLSREFREKWANQPLPLDEND